MQNRNRVEISGNKVEIQAYFYIFLCISIFFLFFTATDTSYAARQVPGKVPDVQPLILPPADVVPNIQNNVQMSDPGHPVNTGSNNDTSQENDLGNQQSSESNGSLDETNLSSKANSHAATTTTWVIVALFLLGVGLFIYRSRRKNP